MKVGSWNEHNKGLWTFTECRRLGTMTKGHTPGLEAFKGFLLTPCFWEQGQLFHDKTPFRVSQKVCYVLDGGNCILCLNALIRFHHFMANRWGNPFFFLSRKATCKSALCSAPWDHVSAKLDNKICQSTRGCPWMSFQSTVLRALQQIKSIKSSLSFLYGPTLTSIRDYWKNHSFD